MSENNDNYDYSKLFWDLVKELKYIVASLLILPLVVIVLLQPKVDKNVWTIETEFQKVGPVYIGYAKEKNEKGIRVITINPKSCLNDDLLLLPKIGDIVVVNLYDQPIFEETESGDLIIEIPHDFVKIGSLEPVCK